MGETRSTTESTTTTWLSDFEGQPPEYHVAIENVPLGSRLSTRNPEPWAYDYQFPHPEAASWARVEIQFEINETRSVSMSLLRPRSWVDARDLTPGGVIELSIPELKVEGLGVVLAIETSPAIASGDGAVVTGRFITRDAENIVRVTFADGNDLTGTAIHPIWSPERQAWLGLGEFERGDLVQTRDGLLAVESIERLAESAPVYNIEVHGEHVYEVGHGGVLVHNGGAGGEYPNLGELAEAANKYWKQIKLPKAVEIPGNTEEEILNSLPKFVKGAGKADNAHGVLVVNGRAYLLGSGGTNIAAGYAQKLAPSDVVGTIPGFTHRNKDHVEGSAMALLHRLIADGEDVTSAQLYINRDALCGGAAGCFAKLPEMKPARVRLTVWGTLEAGGRRQAHKLTRD